MWLVASLCTEQRNLLYLLIVFFIKLQTKKSFLTGNWFFVSCKNWRKYLPKKGSILLKLTLWHVNHSWFMLWSSCTRCKKLVDYFFFFKNWHDKNCRSNRLEDPGNLKLWPQGRKYKISGPKLLGWRKAEKFWDANT